LASSTSFRAVTSGSLLGAISDDHMGFRRPLWEQPASAAKPMIRMSQVDGGDRLSFQGAG